MANLKNSREVTIPISKELSLRGDLYLSSGNPVEPAPLAIVCHGFTAYRRYLFLPALAQAIADSGINALVVDFSRNGFDGATGQFNNPDLFSKNTFENERLELVQLIAALAERGVPELGVPAPRDFDLVGHSRGGVTVLGAAADPSIASLVSKVSAWSTPSDVQPARFGATPEVLQAWRAFGEVPYPIERLGIDASLKLEVLEEMEQDTERVERFAKAVTVPLLVIHGEVDQRIPLSCGEKIASWAPHGELVVIKDGDHVFNVASASDVSSKPILEAIAALQQFLKSC
ncbi:MAG: alpha/beta fold hydrolase [Bdellovibrionales bacterium]|nr:alpha/beta fold hydrolase [Bdellovibrionales bacterium]